MMDWTKITAYPLDVESAQTHRHALALMADHVQVSIFTRAFSKLRKAK